MLINYIYHKNMYQKTSITQFYSVLLISKYLRICYEQRIYCAIVMVKP